ncbi:hypothetical protein Nepgr_017027 [Nepenthes gracilis]|uniref:Telomerase reverse transcriptase n=1 Tax=Nepenthes gracilis TaxID=150966 RepID=A0AAD3SRS4_NEPGR|nr:hypothetical protein Nepgr_017027 [Nepenthes gracilis]
MGKRKWTARGKRKWIPEVLWRLFREKARTLADTIISLIPQECQCKNQSKCMRCVFGIEDALLSYLIRSEDPPDYHDLLNRCFVVVPENAPPLPSDISPGNRWSQHQIVSRIIETLLAEQPGSSNVICNGYDKIKGLSPIARLLACPAWNQVLKRVGDGIMGYLLTHTSIFLPHPHNKHQQVAGAPVSGLFIEYPKHLSVLDFHGASPIQEDVQETDEQKQSTKPHINLGKRSRLLSWQRHKRLKLLTLQDANTIKPPTCHFSGEESMNLGLYNYSIYLRNHQSCEVHSSEEYRENQAGHEQEMSPKCTCCSVFQTTIKVLEGAQINRQSMFYCLGRWSSPFPKKHVLNSLKPSFSGASYLLMDIFGLSNVDIRPQLTPCLHHLHGSPCLFHSLIKLMKIFIHKAQHCQHIRLLDKHCPIPLLSPDASSLPTGNGIETGASDKEDRSLLALNFLNSSTSSKLGCKKTLEFAEHKFGLNSYCSKNEVVSFIWAACRNIVPPDLLGSPSNWRILRRNICKFIQLRRLEKFSLKQCVAKFKISRFPLLSNKHSLCCFNGRWLKHGKGQDVDVIKGCSNLSCGTANMRQHLLRRWIFWFFSHVVVPLVQANFYVTESEHGKQSLYFYRKSIWRKLSDQTSTCSKDQNYHALDDASVRDILSNRPFGFSKVRLRPKKIGTREIANFKAPSRIFPRVAQSHPVTTKFSHLKSANYVLRDLHAVLKDYRNKEPEKWGASVFDYNDVYRKLCPFLLNLKEEDTTIPGVFIIVSDVFKAFDTVDQDKLLSVVDEILTMDEYVLQKSHEVVCKKKSFCVYENRKVVSLENFDGFTEVTTSRPYRPRHTIILNQEQNRTVRKEELQFYLIEHVKRNVLLFDQSFFLQDVGIPQGSVLSSFLCSLYYGHLERNVIFPFLKKEYSNDLPVLDDDNNDDAVLKACKKKASSPRYILLRLIDDFLFISTSKQQATGFFSRLQRGFREYNCYMNKEKFCVNFDIDHMPWIVSKRVFVGENGMSFLQWSGLLINCCTLEVQGDYTRYLNNHLSSTLTVCWQGKPGRQLKAKLCDYMQPKCHPLFYDSNINSPAIIRLNIYQAFLLCAMKFHCYVCHLSNVLELHPRFYLIAIERSLRYTHKLMKRRMKTVGLGSSCNPSLPLAKEEVLWLGLTAYSRALKKKQSRHKKIHIPPHYGKSSTRVYRYMHKLTKRRIKTVGLGSSCNLPSCWQRKKRYG